MRNNNRNYRLWNNNCNRYNIWKELVNFLRSGNSPIPFGNIIGNAIQFRAAGFHGTVSGPTPMVVGERGAERVDVTPLAGNGRSQSAIHGRGGEGSSSGSGRPIVLHSEIFLLLSIVSRYT